MNHDTSPMDLSKVRYLELSYAFRAGFALANLAAEHAAECCGLSFWGNCLKIACCVQAELHFMKKIPTGAEAANVLVGELDFLHQPIMAFARLTPAVLLSGMTEVPIPTRSERPRFLFRNNNNNNNKIIKFHPKEMGPAGATPQAHFPHPSLLTCASPFPTAAFKCIPQF